MAYRPHGRAYADATSPRAWGICDRCNFTYNHSDLFWQMDFNGTQLYNKRILVCPKCLDVPQPQFLNPILGPDPMPVLNPRPPMYSVDENGPDQDLLAQFIVAGDFSTEEMYIDLFLGNPATTGVSVLQTITGLATRTNVASSLTVSVTNIINNAVIQFTSSSLASVNVDYVAFYTAASGGSLVVSGPLLNPQTAVLYNGLQFPTGNLEILTPAPDEILAWGGNSLVWGVNHLTWSG